jgi:membrane associated rhomboid family serine protease
MNQQDKSRLFHSLFFPMVFVIILWLVKLCEIVFHIELYRYGVLPRSIEGLSGILFSPLIHGDFLHLFSNSIPLLILGSALFYYFKDLGYKVFFLVYIASGFWVWASARQVYHIGASGVVYGLASFLFVSGFIRQNTNLIAFSMFVAFFYGSMIWGMLPIERGVSWESHLMGAIAGLMGAFYYKNIGLQREQYSWEIHPLSDDEVDFDWSGNPPADEIPPSEESKPTTIQINYIYKPSNNNEMNNQY